MQCHSKQESLTRRPRYETQAHKGRELRVAQRIEAIYGWDMEKLPDLYCADFIAWHDGQPIRLCEIKGRDARYEPYKIATQKLDSMVSEALDLGLPCTLFVPLFLERRQLYRFDFDRFVLAKLNESIIHNKKRNDPWDREPSYDIPFGSMERLL